MGQKVHPYGFHLVFNKNWHSKWFSKRDYASLLRHRIANPLMTIGGAARTLRAKRGDEKKREEKGRRFHAV